MTKGTSFSDRIFSVKSEVEFASDPLKSDIPFRSTLYYKQVVDLRNVVQIDAVLHLNARKTGSHKIQIIEAGHKCAGQIADIVAEIITEHPDLQAVSRADSCADLRDGPHVSWVAQSVRARCMQWQALCGWVALPEEEEQQKTSSSEMGKRQVQTMYLGKRPNCFRVYDKLAERYNAWLREKHRHERLAREVIVRKATEALPEVRHTPDPFCSQAVAEYHAFKRRRELLCSGRYYFPFPDFATWFGEQCVGPMTDLVKDKQLPKAITRIERQMGAGRVPHQLSTFEKLFSRESLDFNPFDRLEFSPFDAPTEIVVKHRGPCTDDCKGKRHYTLQAVAAGMTFKRWLETGVTYQHLYAQWNESHHATLTAEKFASFIAAANPPQEITITASELYERYRHSLSRQLAA